MTAKIYHKIKCIIKTIHSPWQIFHQKSFQKQRRVWRQPGPNPIPEKDGATKKMIEQTQIVQCSTNVIEATCPVELMKEIQAKILEQVPKYQWQHRGNWIKESHSIINKMSIEHNQNKDFRISIDHQYSPAPGTKISSWTRKFNRMQ